MRGGVPERGAVLRARLVPLHQHQRGLQRVRVTRFMMPHILLDAPVVFDRLFWRVGTLTFILLLCLQAGPPVRRSGLRDEPPSPGLLGGASGVRPSAGPAAVQLRRLQHQIPAPLSLQGLSERPGGAVQGLLMTSRGPAVGDALPRVSLETAAGMCEQRPCSLTSDQDLAAKVGEIVKPLRDVHDRALKQARLKPVNPFTCSRQDCFTKKKHDLKEKQ